MTFMFVYFVSASLLAVFFAGMFYVSSVRNAREVKNLKEQYEMALHEIHGNALKLKRGEDV